MFCTRVGRCTFIPVICASPAVQAGAFPQACEVSNRYFYHKLEVLLPGHIPLWKRQSLGHQGSLWDTRDQRITGESLDLLSHTCSLHLWWVQAPCQSYANIFSQRASAAARTRYLLILQGQSAFCSFEPYPIIFTFTEIFDRGFFSHFPVVFPFWGGFLGVFGEGLWLLPRRANNKCHGLMPRARTNDASCWHPPATSNCPPANPSTECTFSIFSLC